MYLVPPFLATGTTRVNDFMYLCTGNTAVEFPQQGCGVREQHDRLVGGSHLVYSRL